MDVVGTRITSRTSRRREVNVDATVLTGLERLLTSKIIKKTQAHRRAVRDAVLDEQDRQDNKDSDHAASSTGGTDEDEEERNFLELARVSCKHTAWARKRAHTIGLLNATSENEEEEEEEGGR